MAKSLEQKRNQKREKFRQIKAELVAYKGGLCYDCGMEYPTCCFQFDHRDPAQKSFRVTASDRAYTMAERKAEADKCDLVCANCHALRTFNNPAIAKKISESQSRSPLSVEHRASIGRALIGNQHLLGKSPSLETRELISIGMQGNQNRRANA